VTDPALDIPVIDVAGLCSPDLAERQRVGDELGRACEEVGFLSVIGHGVPAAVIDGAFAAAHRFFASPSEVKEFASLTDGVLNRGYDGVLSQQLDPTSPAPDVKEVFDIGLDLPWDHPLVVAGTPMHGPNSWPDLAGFREPVEAFYDACRRLTERLLAGMALSLGLAEDGFEPFHRTPIATMRLLRYPPMRPDQIEGQLGAGAHTDWGAITVLAQDEAGGLEVQLADGTWVPVPPRRDAFVVNVGDLLARWTNDRYRSTRHRVRNPVDRERFSAVFFMDLDHHARIEVLPSCVAPDEEPRYSPTTAGEHLFAKFQESMTAY
jgi:isopenicillin N synthase-like dioxygenase